jgi:hypothetical protein
MMPPRPLRIALLLVVWGVLISAAPAGLPADPLSLVHDRYGRLKPQLTRLGETLFFVAADLDTGLGVWRTNGTRGGTHRIAMPGAPADLDDVEILGTLGGRIFWSALVSSEPDVRMLFSAGETGGASLLYTGSFGRTVKIFGERLFFLDCSEQGCAIWATDGRPEETRPVQELAGRVVDRLVFEVFADRWLVFQEGTALLGYDPRQGRVQPILKSRGRFRVFPVGDTLFIITHTLGQDGVWASRLSAPQAKLVFSWGDLDLAGWRDGRFYFALDDGRLWSTDGSREGTWAYGGMRVEYFSFLVDQLGPMGSKSVLPMPGYYSGGLLSVDEDRREVREIAHVCSIKYQCLGSTMSPLTVTGGWAFEEINNWLVRTDGTRKGTTSDTGLAEVDPDSFGVVDDHLVLGAVRRGVRQLWETDGTAEGTKALSDGTRDQPFRVQGPPISFNGALFVVAERKPLGKQLWRIARGRTTPVTQLRNPDEP